MTSTNGTSPINQLHQQYQHDLNYALNTYCGGQKAGEITTGTRILGTPIGNSEYVQHYQNKKIQKLRQAINSIHNLVPDPHIAITLFKFSLQHYVTHLLPTDILHNQNTSNEYKQYSTQFTKTINEITKHFIHTIITNTNNDQSTPLPHHAWHLSTTPSGLGGLGFHDIEARAIRTFITPIANSIRSTKYGLIPQKINVKETLLQDINIKLPQHITSTFKGWKQSSLNVFQKYRELTTQYIEGTTTPESRGQQLFTLQTYTLQASLHQTTKQIQKEISIHRLKKIWTNLPIDIKKQFPSTLSTLTSIPLGQSTRIDPTNRFSNDEFKIYIQRKLRLPLDPAPPPTCTCGRKIDKYGDHFFTCKEHNKIALHHRMRDSIYTVLTYARNRLSTNTQWGVLWGLVVCCCCFFEL